MKRVAFISDKWNLEQLIDVQNRRTSERNDILIARLDELNRRYEMALEKESEVKTMSEDFKIKAALEMKKDLEERLNLESTKDTEQVSTGPYTLKDKERIKELVQRNRENEDLEIKKLEEETKELFSELKNTLNRAGRNIKIEVTDDLPPGVTDEEYKIFEEYGDGTAGFETKKAVFHIEELEKLVKNNVDVHLRVGERALRIARDLLQISLKNHRRELTEDESKLVERRYDD